MHMIENRRGSLVTLLLVVTAVVNWPVFQPSSTLAAAHRYEANWTSLDSRPLPDWYDRAKLGIFVHWGVYSVPAFGSEWFWWAWQGRKDPSAVKYMSDNYSPRFAYPEFAGDFTARFFDATAWASIFRSSGAKYVVFTTKHHEGFAMWNASRSWTWNAVSNGPRRDIVRELAEALRQSHDNAHGHHQQNKEQLHLGLYHSLFEWFHPLYVQDRANKWRTRTYVTDKMLPELKSLVMQFRPDVVWSDGDWEAPDTYWQSKEFLAWLYNDSPVRRSVVVNDRWGVGTLCKHGGYLTCADRFSPGHRLSRKFENAFTLDRVSWGHRRNMQLRDVMSREEMMRQLVVTTSCGGNTLINVGPDADGQIPVVFQERLKQLGGWMATNGDAIYATHPCSNGTMQNDSVTGTVWYTCKTADRRSNDSKIFAISLEYPSWTAEQNVSVLELSQITQRINNSTRAELLGAPDTKILLKSGHSSSKKRVTLVLIAAISPQKTPELPWVIQFTNIN